MNWRRYRQTLIGQTGETVCHSAEALVEYLHCPMYWALARVYLDTPKQLGEREALALVMRDWMEIELWSTWKVKSLDHLETDRVKLRDRLGKFLMATRLYQGLPTEAQEALLSEGALMLDRAMPVLSGEITAMYHECFVRADPSARDDTRITVKPTVMYTNPFSITYVTHRELPKGREVLSDPVSYALASVNRRVQRSMGISMRDTRRVSIFSTYDGDITTLPVDPTRYSSGPHWTRALECMDLLGVYPRPSRSCKTCPFAHVCDISKSDIRQMKSSGINRNVSRPSITQRNRLTSREPDEPDSAEPEEADSPDL